MLNGVLKVHYYFEDKKRNPMCLLTRAAISQSV